ncbi:hypothetical protein BSKO_11749 [Bryopsis sp. KO-2023]|nr:hypothetical protein BSKO_11749 [Bryopsis sp. KO-2023]
MSEPKKPNRFPVSPEHPWGFQPWIKTLAIFFLTSAATFLFYGLKDTWRDRHYDCRRCGVESTKNGGSTSDRNHIPGIDYLRFGVDLSTGERTALNLFDFSYRRAEAGDVRFLHESENKSMWMVPDQFWVSDWTDDCMNLSTSSATVLTDVSEFQRVLTDDHFHGRLPSVFDLPLNGGESLGSALLRYDKSNALSNSDTILGYLKSSKEGRATLVTWSQHTKRYTAIGDDVAFKRTQRLRSKIHELEKMCKDLDEGWRFGDSIPQPLSKCEKLAAMFVKEYGTHYTSTATIGGVARLSFTIDFMRFTPEDMDIMVECRNDLIGLILSGEIGECLARAHHVDAIVDKVEKHGEIRVDGEVVKCAGGGILSQDLKPVLETSVLEPISNLIQDNNAKAAVELAALDKWMCNGKTYKLKRHGKSMIFDGCDCRTDFHTLSCISLPVPKLRLTNLDKVGGMANFRATVSSTCNRFESLVGCGCEPGVKSGNWPVRLARFYPMRLGNEERCECRVIQDGGTAGKPQIPSKATAICAPMKLGIIPMEFKYVNNSCTPGWGGNKHSNECDVTCPVGFKLLGGGCSSFRGSDSRDDWQIGQSHPIDESTWHCAMFEDRGVPLHYVGVQAFGVCGKWQGLETKLISKQSRRSKPTFADFSLTCPEGYVATAGGAGGRWRKNKLEWRLTHVMPVNNGQPWEMGSWDSKSWEFRVGEDYGTGVYRKVATGWVVCVKEVLSIV